MAQKPYFHINQKIAGNMWFAL